MNQLVRARSTMKFLASGGQWTNNINEARTFATIGAVLSTRDTLPLQDCELYFSFLYNRISEYDFAIPLEKIEGIQDQARKELAAELKNGKPILFRSGNPPPSTTYLMFVEAHYKHLASTADWKS